MTRAMNMARQRKDNLQRPLLDSIVDIDESFCGETSQAAIEETHEASVSKATRVNLTGSIIRHLRYPEAPGVQGFSDTRPACHNTEVSPLEPDQVKVADTPICDNLKNKKEDQTTELREKIARQNCELKRAKKNARAAKTRLQNEKRHHTQQIGILRDNLAQQKENIHRLEENAKSLQLRLSEDESHVSQEYSKTMSAWAQDVSRDLPDDIIRNTFSSFFKGDFLSWCADMCVSDCHEYKIDKAKLQGCDFVNLSPGYHSGPTYLQFDPSFQNESASLVLVEGALSSALCEAFLAYPFFSIERGMGLNEFAETVAETSIEASVDWRVQTLKALGKAGKLERARAIQLAHKFAHDFGFLLKAIDKTAFDDLVELFMRFSDIALEIWATKTSITFLNGINIWSLEYRADDPYRECDANVPSGSRKQLNGRPIGVVMRPCILSNPVSSAGKNSSPVAMVVLFGRLFGKSPSTQNYAPIGDDDVVKCPKEATKVSSLFFVSPAQLWIGSLISRVNKAGEIEQDWLPHFKRDATKLRALFEPLQDENGSVWYFLLQFEIGGMLLLGAVLEIASFTASLGAPLILHSFLQTPSSIPLAWAIVVATFLATVCGRAKDQVCRVHAAWIECMLRSVIFEKSLKLSPAARVAYPSAKIININAVDVGFLTNYVLKIHDVWSAPLQILGIGILTMSVMGWTSCVGFALVVIIFISQTSLGKRLGKSIGEYIAHNDRRIGFLRDMLNNTKSVKASAMEDVFQDKITSARNDELGVLRYYLTTSFAMFTAINQTTPYLAACAAFLTYAMAGEKLTAAVVFPCLAYFQLLFRPVTLASLALSRQFSVKPSLGRVRGLLTASESRINISDCRNESPTAIAFDEAVFEWPREGDSTPTSLNVGNLNIPRGKTSLVIGPNGSGKTSLLQSILGEMILSKGSCIVNGSVAYCSQDPWILSGDLSDNIVFNSSRKIDRERYKKIVQACGLDKDFAKLPGGIEHATVGEAGTNLSGGQRARVSVARALYSDADILLLDDPLSALDAHVRTDIFDAICNSGKTVVLVTLHTSFVSQVDNVIVVDSNKLRWSGPKSEFLQQDWISDYVRHENEEENPSETTSTTATIPQPTAAEESITVADSPLDSFWQEEERARGAVDFSVIKFYIRESGGTTHAIAVALMTCLLTAAKVVSQYWFVWWIANSFGLTQGQYMGIFLCLTLLQGVVTAAVGITLVGSSLRAARRVHERILSNLIGAPLWFFQQNPTGRILNRMSRDLDSMDSRLMNAIDGLLAAGTTMLASVAIVASSGVFLFGAVVPFLLIVGWCLQRFRVAAREVQRLDSVLQSPALSIVSESLRAPSSVRAYGAIPFLVRRHGYALDRLASAKICRSSLDTWVTFRSEIAAATILLVLAQLTVHGVIPHVSASLALSTATTLANNVYLLAWAATDLEIQLNSVERLQIYHEGIPRENTKDSWADEEEREDGLESWPENNSITIDEAYLKYRTRKTPAIDRISLQISHGQKIGLVGRTGSGKSTLLSAIARLVDINDGKIVIGNTDTAKIMPRRLRRDVITLPQESLIFEGTLRENLDPYSRRTDGEIWDALEATQMGSVLRIKFGAEALIQELSSDGADLSAGQRQLICAARVLLERPSVLLVDEASANVDFASDDALQRAWQALPASTTMITIAHRASSLAWMDRVIVMENGKLLEDGKPRDLLSGSDGSSYYRAAIEKDGPRAVQAALETAVEWDTKKQRNNM
ncbi:hypothetical protein PWT90_01091 [Aphanocladium album]|nr:hypothetical protein PWT90_01091 [Aphanocladium album]